MRPTAKIGILLTALFALLFCAYGVYHLSQPKAQAKIALTRFLDACKDGDSDKIKRYSMLEELVTFWEFASGDTFSEDAADEMAESAAALENYRILSGGEEDLLGRDQTVEQIRSNIINERKIAQKAKAEKGIEVDLSGQENEQKMIDYLLRIEDEYIFNVQSKLDGEWPEESEEMYVVKYNGVWRVDIVSPYILIPTINDPYETENETQTQEDTP